MAADGSGADGERTDMGRAAGDCIDMGGADVECAVGGRVQIGGEGADGGRVSVGGEAIAEGNVIVKHPPGIHRQKAAEQEGGQRYHENQPQNMV